MTYAAVSVAASQVDDPLAKQGSIDEGVAPKRMSNAGILINEPAQGTVGDEGNLAWSDRCQAVIHHFDVQAEQVRDVAGYVEGHDLALAVAQILVAAEKAFDEQAALRGSISLADNVGIGPEVCQLYRQPEDSFPVVIGEGSDGVELADERV
jgi:hypothetical protein